MPVLQEAVYQRLVFVLFAPFVVELRNIGLSEPHMLFYGCPGLPNSSAILNKKGTQTGEKRSVLLYIGFDLRPMGR